MGLLSLHQNLTIFRQNRFFIVQMFLKILILALILLSLSILGLMLNILVKKKGKFPAYRVGHNRDMQRLGITCVKHEELRYHNKKLKEDEACEGCQQPV